MKIMFSVNIDKLVGMTINEEKSYNDLVGTIKSELGSKKCLAVTKNAMSTFKLAYSFTKAGEKVLFIDGDIVSDVFLGKYKLGKNMKGVSDFLKKTDGGANLICKTNNSDMDIIFTGVLEDGVVTDDEEEMMRKLIAKFLPNYDRIVISADEEGRIAKYCDGTVIMYDESEFGEISAQNYTSELEDKNCNVLGVVINE